MTEKFSKCVFAFTVFSISTITAFAQKERSAGFVGFNAIYARPVGEFKNSFSFGGGLEVYGGGGWDNTYILASVGYRLFGESLSFSNGGTFECTHVKFGVKQFFSGQKTLFVQGDIGIASIKYGGVTQSNFAPDIGAGVRLGKFELGLFYETFRWKSGSFMASKTSADNLNVKAGFSFPL